MRKITYTKPSITELEISYVTDAITNGWGSSCYDYIFKFQDLFKRYLEIDYAIATSSCTGAIHIALKTANIGPGDEVIVPDSTWIASAAPVTYLGATPIFTDILPDTWCLDPKDIEKVITPKTKAIIAVHLYGGMCDMDQIMSLAKKYNLIVIEDAAQALGSEYKGRKAGTIGDFGVFSFHGTKTLTTGEGGMLVTNNKNYFELASIIHDQGRNPKIKKIFWSERIGLKYKISNLQAALGCAQVERVQELVDEKIHIFKSYQRELEKIDGITFNCAKEDVLNCYWLPTVVFDESLKLDRDALLNYLISKSIDPRPCFYPLSSLPEFKKNKRNPVSERLGKNGINLPSSFGITQDEIQYVIKELRAYFE